ncbi:MAG: hypothetical protein ABI673_10965 [Novosphingobium sp.]
MRGLARFAAVLALVTGLAACDAQPTPQPSQSTIARIPEPEPKPSATRLVLDYAALDQHDPDRVLAFYSSALATADWLGAARVWGEGAGVDAKALERRYGQVESPTLLFGKGEAEGAAGSLYYEVTATLTDGSGAVLGKGTVTLRRVNGVPGATPSALRWHFAAGTPVI